MAMSYCDKFGKCFQQEELLVTKKAAPNILNSAKPAGAVAAAAGGGGGGGGAASVDVADIRKITVSFPLIEPDEIISLRC